MNEMRRANELVSEVVDFFTSDRLLQPVGDYETKTFRCHSREILIRVTSLAEYIRDIDINNSDSYCYALDEGLFSRLQEVEYFLSDYETDGVIDKFHDPIGPITDMLPGNPRIRMLAEAAFSHCPDSIDFDDIHGHVANRVGVIAWQIIDARLLMMGPRFGITEALFAAFQDGLLPYGWNLRERTIVCVRLETSD